MIRSVIRGFTATTAGRFYLVMFLLVLVFSVSSEFAPGELADTISITSLALTIAFVGATINLARFLGCSIWSILVLVILPFFPLGTWVNLIYFANVVRER